MAATTQVGPQWTGNISWASGEGGTPGTTKYVIALDSAQRTVQATGSPTIPIPNIDAMIASDDLESWDYVALWIEVIKTVGSTNIPWNVKQLMLWPIVDANHFTYPSWPGSGHLPIFFESGAGTMTTANRNLMDFAGSNSAFPDNVTTSSAPSRAFIPLATNVYTGRVKCIHRVACSIVLQPNVAIAATQTFSVKLNWIYSKEN